MEFKIIESRTFEKLKQCLHELLERSSKLNPQAIQDEWYTNRDVCRLLGVSLRTMQNYRDKGLIPYSQVGHKCYYKIKNMPVVVIGIMMSDNNILCISDTHLLHIFLC